MTAPAPGGAIELVKHGHACVTVRRGDRRLVIDPGVWTEPEALEEADAVLVTHGHPDHVDLRALRAALRARPGLEVWTNAQVAETLDGPAGQVHVVEDGAEIEAAGLAVRVVGEWHAQIHPDVPGLANTGFLVAGQVFHPGDALTFPGTPVEVLCVPLHGPWVKTAELVDWIRLVAPRRTLAVHEALLSERGLALMDRLLGAEGPGTGAEHVRLGSGEHLTV